MVEERPVERIDASSADQVKGARDVVVEPLQHSVDTSLAGCSEGVEVRTADHSCGRACSDGLDQVAAPTDATVDVDLGAATNRVGDGRDQRKRGGCAIE